MAWGLVEYAVTFLMSLLAAELAQEQQEAAMRRRWEELRPAVQADLDKRGPEIASLRHTVPHNATIYATVLLDVITIQVTAYDHTTEGYFNMDFVAPVTFGTEDVQGMGRYTAIDPEPGGNAIHRPLRMSFPVSVPPSRVLPTLASLHRSLVIAQTMLAKIHRRTAGEAVAFDDLAIAVQATDYSTASPYVSRSNADRYATTMQHLTEAIGELDGPAVDNADIRMVAGLLRTHADIVDSLSSRWPAMDPA
jgi:hypothetical protein